MIKVRKFETLNCNAVEITTATTSGDERVHTVSIAAYRVVEGVVFARGLLTVEQAGTRVIRASQAELAVIKEIVARRLLHPSRLPPALDFALWNCRGYALWCDFKMYYFCFYSKWILIRWSIFSPLLCFLTVSLNKSVVCFAAFFFFV